MIKDAPSTQPFIMQAKYIGSDYTYAYCLKFRDTIFRENTLDESLLIGLTKRAAPGEESKENQSNSNDLN